MLPKNIAEKDFMYNQLDEKDIKKFYDLFIELLTDFSKTINQTSELEPNRPIIYRICERIDQRKDYYMYYHSNKEKIMRMSREKELALLAYWVCKYKPIRFKNVNDDGIFFMNNGCTVSDAFASYIIISTVCAKKKRRAKYFSSAVVAELYYDMANRDFSKEAIISRINDLIQSSKKKVSVEKH